ncbi:MAG: hypothetical protein CVU89_16425 [Firmicutes bacterium HGW-Firmicutes-14]|nr:MAG: hypothetical protein CVU89_16425 [Firmicutes bacterium HGW-Firmicutes-14]
MVKKLSAMTVSLAAGIIVLLAAGGISHGMTPVSNEEVRAKLREILMSPEFFFSRWSSSLSDGIGAFLDRVLGSVASAVGSMGIAGYLFLFVLFAAVCFLVYYAGSRISRAFNPDKSAPGENSGVTAGADDTRLREMAVRFAEAGDYRNAVRHLYLSLLLFMDKRSLISFRQSKTNGEYLRELRTVSGDTDGFAVMSNFFERKWYGMEQCGIDDYQEFTTMYMGLAREGQLSKSAAGNY